VRVDPETCIGCGHCIPYCPVKAISLPEEVAVIDEDECLECSICYRTGVCPSDSLIPQREGLRALRHAFSDPLVPHKDTSVPGRGTEEMKTNEVTGRIKRGYAGVAVELGRPGSGARFRDVEKVAMACAEVGVRFEPANPVTSLMVDRVTGKLRDEVLNEKVLSAIVEFDVPMEKLESVLEKVRQVAAEVDTVFSVDLSCRVEPDNTVPAEEIARRAGFIPSLNGKTNVGLGRPLAKEE